MSGPVDNTGRVLVANVVLRHPVTGDVVTFLAGETCPPWAGPLITNEGCFTAAPPEPEAPTVDAGSDIKGAAFAAAHDAWRGALQAHAKPVLIRCRVCSTRGSTLAAVWGAPYWVYAASWSETRKPPAVEEAPEAEAQRVLREVRGVRASPVSVWQAAFAVAWLAARGNPHAAAVAAEARKAAVAAGVGPAVWDDRIQQASQARAPDLRSVAYAGQIVSVAPDRIAACPPLVARCGRCARTAIIDPEWLHGQIRNPKGLLFVTGTSDHLRVVNTLPLTARPWTPGGYATDG